MVKDKGLLQRRCRANVPDVVFVTMQPLGQSPNDQSPHGGETPEGGAGKPRPEGPPPPSPLQDNPLLSLDGVRSLDLRAHDFDRSLGPDSQSRSGRQARPPLSREIPDIIKDLGNTERIRSQFTIDSLKPLGSGGMGVVVSGFDPTLNRTQAIKVLTAPPSPEAVERFRGEAALIAALSHPNLVKIYSYGVSNEGRPFFVMDRVEQARTLDAVTENYFDAAVTDPTTVEWRNRDHQLVRYFLETVRAVEYLHLRGIVHHDLKPSNILISTEKAPATEGSPAEQRRVFVTDFGLSTSTDLTGGSPAGHAPAEAPGFRGTVCYAAPEQLPGRGPVTPRTDVYQLGLILRQIVLNEPPFERDGASSGREILKRLGEARDPVALYGDPFAVNAALPRELVAIIHKATAIDPAARYATAGELRADLEAFLDGRWVAGLATTLPLKDKVPYGLDVTRRTIGRWIGANKVLAAVLALTAAGGVGGTKYLLDRESQAATAKLNEERDKAERERIVLVTEQARQRVAEALPLTRQLADTGNLAAAVALVQPEVVVELRRNAHGDKEILDSLQLLERETAERRLILDLRKLELKAYASAFDESGPEILGEFDLEALHAARAVYLPDGLTPAGIEKFKSWMEEAHYTPRQRRELMERLTQLSVIIMSVEAGALPWSSRLEREERLRLSAECDAIAAMAKGCRVTTLEISEGFAAPTTIERIKFLIEKTDNPEIPNRLKDNGGFGCDLTLSTFFNLFGRSYPLKESLAASALRYAESARSANTDAFLDNILFARLSLLVEGEPVKERYRRHLTACTALISAYGLLESEGIQNRALALEILNRTREGKILSLMLPPIDRPSDRGVVNKVRDIVARDSVLGSTPEAKLAIGFILVTDTINSDLTEETARELRSDTRFADDAILLSVIHRVNSNRELDPSDVETLLKSGIKTRTPFFALRVLISVQRFDEAIELAEELRRNNPGWIFLFRTFSGALEPLRERFPERFEKAIELPN